MLLPAWERFMAKVSDDLPDAGDDSGEVIPLFTQRDATGGDGSDPQDAA
jgi:hypothetical protein